MFVNELKMYITHLEKELKKCKEVTKKDIDYCWGVDWDMPKCYGTILRSILIISKHTQSAD